MNDNQKALLFAAQKEIELILNGETNIGHGTRQYVGGQAITITIPDGTTVFRSEGDGDGTVRKTATANLNGYAIMFEFIKYLRKFKQQNVTIDEIVTIATNAIENGTTTEKAFSKLYPDEVKALETTRKELKAKLPLRAPEDTQRRLAKTNKQAVGNIIFHSKEKAA